MVQRLQNQNGGIYKCPHYLFLPQIHILTGFYIWLTPRYGVIVSGGMRTRVKNLAHSNCGVPMVFEILGKGGVISTDLKKNNTHTLWETQYKAVTLSFN